MKSIYLKYGLLAGGIIIVYTFLTFIFIGDFSEITPQKMRIAEYLGYLRYLILLLTIVFSIRSYHSIISEGSQYKTLLMHGIKTALIIALLVAVMEFVFILIYPDFYTHYIRIMIENLQSSGASAQQIADYKNEIENYSWMQNPLGTGVFYFFETWILGIVMSLIVATIFRRIK